jgi:hypothetical protein
VEGKGDTKWEIWTKILSIPLFNQKLWFLSCFCHVQCPTDSFSKEYICSFLMENSYGKIGPNFREGGENWGCLHAFWIFLTTENPVLYFGDSWYGFSLVGRVSLLRFVLGFSGPYEAYFEMSSHRNTICSIYRLFHSSSRQARQIFRIENLHLSGKPVIFSVFRTKVNKICKDRRFEASFIVCQMKTLTKTYRTSKILFMPLYLQNINTFE